MKVLVYFDKKNDRRERRALSIVELVSHQFIYIYQIHHLYFNFYN